MGNTAHNGPFLILLKVVSQTNKCRFWALPVPLNKYSLKVKDILSAVDQLIPALLLSVLNSVLLWDLLNQW